jgi:hypothetical protein
MTFFTSTHHRGSQMDDMKKLKTSVNENIRLGSFAADREKLLAEFAKLGPMAKILAIPIDFKQLIADGVLAKSDDGYYQILDFKALPEHAKRKIEEMRNGPTGSVFRFCKPNKKQLEFLNKLAAMATQEGEAAGE